MNIPSRLIGNRTIPPATGSADVVAAESVEILLGIALADKIHPNSLWIQFTMAFG